MSAVPLEVVDLSDLDLLDDEHTHARCVRCTGYLVPRGTPFVALCGRRAVTLADVPPGVIPADACPECLDLYWSPCSRCGGAA